MSVIERLKSIYRKRRINKAIRRESELIKSYIDGGRKPWSPGYNLYKDKYLKKVIGDEEIILLFKEGKPLPANYGEKLDERVVEYPWFISRVGEGGGRILDAGSSINHLFMLEHPDICKKELTIMTLEPESKCYWNRRISYQYSDIRKMPFKDGYFDEVVSISTLEHVGMDNSLYSDNEAYIERRREDYIEAISEIKRVLKSGGYAYITVPYGKYTNFGWYQQFNAEMIDKLINAFAPSSLEETYYCYTNDGWSNCDKKAAKDYEGFNIHDTKYFNPDSKKDYDPDNAACSRAIAALKMKK